MNVPEVIKPRSQPGKDVVVTLADCEAYCFHPLKDPEIFFLVLDVKGAEVNGQLDLRICATEISE